MASCWKWQWTKRQRKGGQQKGSGTHYRVGQGRWHGSTLIYLQAVVKGESWKLKFCWMERIYLAIASLPRASAWQRNYICTFNLLNASNALSDSHMCYDHTTSRARARAWGRSRVGLGSVSISVSVSGVASWKRCACLGSLGHLDSGRRLKASFAARLEWGVKIAN